MRPRFNTLIASALMAVFMAPAHALDVTEMSKEERAAFRAEVRAYLLDNPEVIMEAVAVLEQRQTAQQAQDDVSLIRANADAIFSDGHSWVGGNPEGDVTVVEFMDYRCGYCRRASPEVTELVDSDGDIRFILKEFPILGEESMLSSRYAIAVKQLAGDDAYKSAHDTLMNFKGSISEASLRRISGTLGFDAEEILAHMQSDRVTEVIAANHALARELGISGTPSFVLDDRMLRGYVPLDGMRDVVADIRAQ
ncbi:DsbA family protein [Roseovarius sp. TE539]|uniref:DsbA family protein n=1 Tax=Roseovarius sp. TE539 TaxID=2249812 RepID=UPI000DDF7F6E|nr:DsbA family protein [Roseovarius sp. TE539]RBI77337.1 DsbA family protein [Roseovarius sp. TE539]